MPLAPSRIHTRPGADSPALHDLKKARQANLVGNSYAARSDQVKTSKEEIEQWREINRANLPRGFGRRYS
jgi:hypothetical protein